MAGFSLAGFIGNGYEKGRSTPWQVAWFIVLHLWFMKWWFPPRLRPYILKAFGGDIGKGVLIRHNVRVHWPWKLTIGDSCWIGEDVWILNLEPVTIGHDTCISQGAFLCTGSHNRKSPTFEFDNGPIRIGNSVWIAARAVILRGSIIEDNITVNAQSVTKGRVASIDDYAATETRVAQ